MQLNLISIMNSTNLENSKKNILIFIMSHTLFITSHVNF